MIQVISLLVGPPRLIPTSPSKLTLVVRGGKNSIFDMLMRRIFRCCVFYGFPFWRLPTLELYHHCFLGFLPTDRFLAGICWQWESKSDETCCRTKEGFVPCACWGKAFPARSGPIFVSPLIFVFHASLVIIFDCWILLDETAASKCY